MSRRPKNNKNAPLHKKPDSHTTDILKHVGNKKKEFANKFMPNKWRMSVSPNIDHKKQLKKRKQKIPIALRQACWIQQFGETYRHKCFVDWCHRKITCFDFEVGHNLPESKGGTLDLYNLRPICRQCNIGMGNMYTIDQWRKLNIKH